MKSTTMTKCGTNALPGAGRSSPSGVLMRSSSLSRQAPNTSGSRTSSRRSRVEDEVAGLRGRARDGAAVADQPVAPGMAVLEAVRVRRDGLPVAPRREARRVGALRQVREHYPRAQTLKACGGRRRCVADPVRVSRGGDCRSDDSRAIVDMRDVVRIRLFGARGTAD